MNIIEIIIFLFVIVPQPYNDPLWVSSQADAVTRWEYVNETYNVHGLLAHDYMAGGYFYNLHTNDKLYADGFQYTVSDIRFYDASVTDEYIFYDIYTTPERLILQTCWGDGFMFVISDPTGKYDEKYDNELAFVKDAQFLFEYSFDYFMK